MFAGYLATNGKTEESREQILPHFPCALQRQGRGEDSTLALVDRRLDGVWEPDARKRHVRI